MASSDRKIWANKNGVWSQSTSAFNVGGTWVEPIAAYGRVNGGWKQFWPPTGAALFTTDGTWTVPIGITRVNAIVMGGGAGGGAGRLSTSANGGGGGGGGGAIAKQENLVVVPGTTCRITIGQGGRGAEANSGRAGANGGTSTFVLPSGQTVSGWGGGGGGGVDQPPPQTPGGGGGGGAASASTGVQQGATGAANGGRGWTNGSWDLGGGGGGSNFDGAPSISYEIGKFSGAGGWSPFINTYGIWNPNVNSPTFDQSYNVYFSETGNHTIEASIDNYGQVLIDGVVALDQTDSYGYRTSITSVVYVTTGWHTVRLACTNTGGPGSVGVKITSPSGKEPMTTVNLPRAHEGGHADGINGYGGDGSQVNYLDKDRVLGSVVIGGGGAGGYHANRGITAAQASIRTGGAGGGGNAGQDGNYVGGGGGGCAGAGGPTGSGYRGQVYLYW